MNVGRFDPRFNPNASFRTLLTAAINDLAANGYVSAEKLSEWIALLRNAAERELGSDKEVDAQLRQSLGRVFERFVNGRKLESVVPGVGRYTLAMVKPQLRAELDRRILASADLIKYHRQEAIDRTLRRFAGWSTSIPVGGDEDVNRRDVKAHVGKALVNYRYHKRLVDTDQGHKLVANVADLVATEAGAIAAVWNSHGAHDHSYNARKTHLDRNGKTYLIRDSWAHREGLVKPLHGFTDDMTTPGQEVNCRCWYTYLTSPRRLPDAMLTRKGQEWVQKGQTEMRMRMAG